MTPHLIRSTVPPRELAATINARSVTRAGWAVAFIYLVISVLTLIDLWISRNYPPILVFSLVGLVAIISALIALVRNPTRARGILFLAVGAASGFVYDYALLLADPSLNLSGTYLLNRVTVAMLLIGALGENLLAGVVWCSAGFILGTAATTAAQLSIGLPILPGYGPLVSLIIYLVIIMMFVVIRHRQRRYNPDFSAVGAEAARMAGQRELEERAVAIVHDTVLNDLTALVNGRNILEERMRDRIRRDIAAVSQAQFEPESGSRGAAAGDLRDELLALMSEFQWRGLTVEISGGDVPTVEIGSGVTSALLGAVSGSLENVLLHSGMDSAEVFVDVTEDSLSVMIVDHGRGFDPAAVPDDRLGIRRILVNRIERNGGTVRIWSALGLGTSVVITVPLGVNNV